MDKQKLFEELLKNKRVAEAIKQWELSKEQIEDALPIFIDMANEGDDQDTLYLTSIQVVDGLVKRVQTRSSYAKKQVFLENIKTNKYEPFNFEEDQEFFKEPGRKKAWQAIVNIWKKIDHGHWRGVYLYGDMGIGKTFMLKQLAKKMAQKNLKVGFISPANILEKVKDSFSLESSQSQLIKLLKEVDCLILDDIGAEAITAWFRDEILFAIINFRLQNHKLTFFSSNYSIEKLVDVQSRTTRQNFRDFDKAKRLVSRIQALALPIQVMGDNKRY